MSDANRTTVAFLPETTLGVLPAPANFQRLRVTKEALEYMKETVKSEEIRPDRNTSEAVRVGVGAKGTVDFEMAITDFETFLEAALGGTFASNVLINGTARKSFILEKQFPLPDGVTTSFMLFKGMAVNQLTLNMVAKQIVTGQLDFLGVNASESTATSDTSGVIGEAGTGLILSASSNVAAIEADDVAVSTVKSLNLTIGANLRTNDVIGSEIAADIGQGSFTVTGKMEAYFNSRTLLTKFMDHSAVKLEFSLTREAAGAQSGDTVGYSFEIPALRFTKGNPSAGGMNQDVMLPLEFSAEGSAGAQATGALTFTGQPADTQQVVVGGKTYTFQTVLTNVNGNVKIGVDLAASIANLVKAVKLTGVAGTDYAAAMTLHPTITAVGSATVFTATAVAKGTAGNAIATTTTVTGATWAAATLAGGLDIYTMKITRLLKA